MHMTPADRLIWNADAASHGTDHRARTGSLCPLMAGARGDTGCVERAGLGIRDPNWLTKNNCLPIFVAVHPARQHESGQTTDQYLAQGRVQQFGLLLDLRSRYITS